MHDIEVEPGSDEVIEGKGIEIIDLGVDVDPQDFVKCAIERRLQHHLLFLTSYNYHANAW